MRGSAGVNVDWGMGGGEGGVLHLPLHGASSDTPALKGSIPNESRPRLKRLTASQTWSGFGKCERRARNPNALSPALVLSKERQRKAFA